MRVTFTIVSLGAGGAERVMSTMANYWAEKGWSVTILTLDDGKEAPFFSLHSAIAHESLGLASQSPNPIYGILKNLTRARVLRRAIKKTQPDVVISFMDQMNILTLSSTWGSSRPPIIVMEQNDPYSRPIPWYWAYLRYILYRLATRIVVLNESAKSYYPLSIRQRIVVIFNPALAPQRNEASPDPVRPNNYKIILGMGRLVHQKGFDLLIRAFAELSPRYPDWLLQIWGEGPMRKTLEGLVEQRGLGDHVSLPGRTTNPVEKMKSADLFVLSSRYEGFPMVLGEAMACGLPVVSFNCPTGPEVMIRDGVDGVLVPPEDISALGTALDRLMGDTQERRRFAEHAPEILQRFGVERIMENWEALLSSLVP